MTQNNIFVILVKSYSLLIMTQTLQKYTKSFSLFKHHQTSDEILMNRKNCLKSQSHSDEFLSIFVFVVETCDHKKQILF